MKINIQSLLWSDNSKLTNLDLQDQLPRDLFSHKKLACFHGIPPPCNARSFSLGNWANTQLACRTFLSFVKILTRDRVPAPALPCRVILHKPVSSANKMGLRGHTYCKWLHQHGPQWSPDLVGAYQQFKYTQETKQCKCCSMLYNAIKRERL